MKNAKSGFKRTLLSVIPLLFFICGFFATAQIKIGNNPSNIDGASVLELESTSKAFILSRVNNSQMLGITPLQGALIYNTEEACVFYFNGGVWNNLCQTGSNITFTDNGDNTFTIDDGAGGSIILGGPETVTTMTLNPDNSITYNNEAGQETTFSVSSVSFVDNGDNTFTINDGNGGSILVNGPETVTTMIANPDGTYTYTNEAMDITTISFTGGQISGIPGSVFFAGADGNSTEDNAELFWNDINKQLGIGTNTGLNDKLTVAGTISVADGLESTPSYRFSNDGDTGMYRKGVDELAFSTAGDEKARIDNIGVLLNKAITFNTHPLVVRGSPMKEILAIQDTDGTTQFHIDLNGTLGPGLNLIETGVRNNRLFVQKNGGVGIGTDAPEAELDVAGTLRVRTLNTSPGTFDIVTVDANGVLHRAAPGPGSTAKGISNSNNGSVGRWSSNSLEIPIIDGKHTLPIFENEDFMDGTLDSYKVSGNSLMVKQAGTYDIRINILLVLPSNIRLINSTTRVRMEINGSAAGVLGTLKNVQNTGSTGEYVMQLYDILRLEMNDTMSIVLENYNSDKIYLSSVDKSSFAINKL